MAYWLVKSEPSSYSWDQLVADGRTHWNGVRNAQALNNLRAMKPGDRAFFYHSNEGRRSSGSSRWSKVSTRTLAIRAANSAWWTSNP